MHGFLHPFAAAGVALKFCSKNPMISEYSIGWDIGGAHVKVAVLQGDRLIEAAQYPCPLWLGLSRLEARTDQILARLQAPRANHAVTMTGELADSFATREEGVRRILEVLGARIDSKSLYVFAGNEGLLDFDRLSSGHFAKIASANWLATAVYAARILNTAVLIDIGSTTTDILIVRSGEVLAKGFSDYERLVSGELVYTGVVRTPVAALVKQVPFEGVRVPLMAELFATTADVYRLTGELPEDYDQWPAADGAEKTPEASARRLARMIGRDLCSASLASWTRLAAYCREVQVRDIQDAVLRCLSRLDSGDRPTIVGAGIGRFLAADLGARAGLEYQDFSSSAGFAAIPGASECAPAVAVARLLALRMRC
jgi:(4-(4-[2-(gamma-L-glutamylamino)ethyl]phenoxymethyl)furan-2-yl)methanamine synthase